MNVAEIAPGSLALDGAASRTGEEAADDWEPEVGCVYYEAPEATVLIDPLVPEERERFSQALDRDVERRGLPQILLTVPGTSAASPSWSSATPRPTRRRPASSRSSWPRSTRRSGGCRSTRRWSPATCWSAPAGGIEVCPDSWLDERSSHTSIRAALAPLLELPLERVIVSHGEPVLGDGRAALARALG